MNNLYYSIINGASQGQRVQPPKAAQSSQPKPPQKPRQKPEAPAAKTAAKTTSQKQSGNDRRAEQLEAMQQKLAAQKAAANAGNAVVINKNELTPEKVREIFVWTEILGEPKCRQRHRSRSRRNVR